MPRNNLDASTLVVDKGIPMPTPKSGYHLRKKTLRQFLLELADGDSFLLIGTLTVTAAGMVGSCRSAASHARVKITSETYDNNTARVWRVCSTKRHEIYRK